MHLYYLFILCIYFFNPYLKICLLILEREKYQCKRNISLLPALHALTGNKSRNLLVYGMTLQPTEPPSQCHSCVILRIL